MSNILEVAGKGFGWVCGKVGDVITWLLSKGFKALGIALITAAKSLSGMDNVFILVGLVGCIIIITGRKELGTKLTSGSIIGYIVCKGVEAYASC